MEQLSQNILQLVNFLGGLGLGGLRFCLFMVGFGFGFICLFIYLLMFLMGVYSFILKIQPWFKFLEHTIRVQERPGDYSWPLGYSPLKQIWYFKAYFSLSKESMCQESHLGSTSHFPSRKQQGLFWGHKINRENWWNIRIIFISVVIMFLHISTSCLSLPDCKRIAVMLLHRGMGMT